MFERMENSPGARFLLILACLIVVVAGIRAAAPILVPFALALFLAVVSMPVMFGLRRKRVPAPVAIGLTVLLDVVIFGLVILLAANSVGNLEEKLPRYRTATEQLFTNFTTWLSDHVLLSEGSLALDMPDLSGWIFDFVGTTVQTVASLFSVGFLVALIMVFILAEATVFPFKFQSLMGSDRSARLRMTKTITEVQAYLGIKTVVSLATGITAGVFSWQMGLDFPILLGLVAFVLNFVPTIGSILAAIPAVVLALILHDPTWALFVALGYLAINTLFGNIIEPNLMGRRLGLSTLVVVLSLVFWGWVWGPIGAMLSVPLTMVLKIVLENTPDLRWIAVLLDKVPPQARRAEARAAELAASRRRSGEPPVSEGPGVPTPAPEAGDAVGGSTAATG